MTTADHAGLPLSATAPTLPVSEIIIENEFATLGLQSAIVKALDDLDYKKPTPVQAQAIPAFLAGRDLLVSSQTGSGKTAAFILPALQLISQKPLPQVEDNSQRVKGRRPRPQPARPHLVVLTPTRELAQQVTSATTQFDKYLKRTICASIVGGMPYPKQLDMLAKMPDILVATPGRLLDHMNSGRIDLSELSMLVFDEADRMLDMGFADDIDAIVGRTPENRQTLMFSATLAGRIGDLAAEMLRDPVRISIAQKQMEYDKIEQRIHFVDDINHKQRVLEHLLTNEDVQQAIVFTGTKAEADLLADDLCDKGFSASALHGDMKQSMRNRTLSDLRRGDIQILVATDVAARGIDIPNISHVVNYDLPKHGEDYIHRIGRTGRAGRTGTAINLVQHGERFKWQRIERLLPIRVEVTEIAGLEPQRAPKPRTGADTSRSKDRWSNDRKDRNSSRPAPRRDARLDDRGFRGESRPAVPRFDERADRPARAFTNDAPRFDQPRPAAAPRQDRFETVANSAPRADRDFNRDAPRGQDFGNARPAPRRFENAPYSFDSDRARRPARAEGADRPARDFAARDSAPRGDQQPRRFADEGRSFAGAARPAAPRGDDRGFGDKPARRTEGQFEKPRRSPQEWVRR